MGVKVLFHTSVYLNRGWIQNACVQKKPFLWTIGAGFHRHAAACPDNGDFPGSSVGEPAGLMGTTVGGSSAGMTIHKSEGLVPINEKCESNIPGLYDAGDALGFYMAGAIFAQTGSSLAGKVQDWIVPVN